MPAAETGLVARAKGLATHLVARPLLERLAEADDLRAFALGLSRLGTAIEPVGEPVDVPAIERAVARTASRFFSTLDRWQERVPGVLDVFAAHQDRRSLRALLRGAVQGAPAAARVDGLLPTPSLPHRALTALARQASPADVVRQLVLLAHPQSGRLLPFIEPSQLDLFAVDVTLLMGFAERATRAAARGDHWLRDFVAAVIDIGNAQNALLSVGEPREVDPGNVFVRGGRLLSAERFAAAARAESQSQALALLVEAFSGSPLASSLPAAPSDARHIERAFLASTIERLARAARIEPLTTAPVLRLALLVEAQSRDLRALAWGAALGTPPTVRRQQLVTPA